MFLFGFTQEIDRTLMEYWKAHELVKNNPKKLLEAKGKEECNRVGQECARSMDIFHQMEDSLFRAARAFMEHLMKYPQELRNLDKGVVRRAFAAVRFMTAHYEWSVDETRFSSKGPMSPATTRYFDGREEVLRLAKEIVDGS